MEKGDDENLLPHIHHHNKSNLNYTSDGSYGRKMAPYMYKRQVSAGSGETSRFAKVIIIKSSKAEGSMDRQRRTEKATLQHFVAGFTCGDHVDDNDNDTSNESGGSSSKLCLLMSCSNGLQWMTL